MVPRHQKPSAQVEGLSEQRRVSLSRFPARRCVGCRKAADTRLVHYHEGLDAT